MSSNTNSWILITAGASGSGFGHVYYTVLANTTEFARTGVVVIAGQKFTIIQWGLPTITCAPDKIVPCNTAWNFDTPAVGTHTGTNVVLVVLSTVTNVISPSTFTVTRTWDAIGACTNAMCSQTVTVISAPPVINCPADKVVECGLPWTFDSPTVVDGTNVTIRIIGTVTNASGACGRTFSATRMWEVTDRCGNLVTCAQTVQVVDTTAPIISCGGDKSVECGTAWNFDMPAAIDLCDGTNVTIQIASTITNTAGFCGQTFSVIRLWSATDHCGNTRFCSQTVTLVDTTPPVLTCGANKTEECGAAWSFDRPTAFDSCDGTNVTIRILGTVTNSAGLCGSTFAATRTWSASDGCGNSNVCSQTVTVVDTTPPQLTCAPNLTVECGAAWNFTTPSANDSCGGTNVTIRILSTVTNLGCGPTLSATRTWEGEDGCGNRATCSQTVNVIAKALEVACATNRSVNCSEAWTFDAPSIQSGCASAATRIVSTTTNLGCGHALTATRTWEVSDGCTNVTCQQTITVVDNPPMVMPCWNRMIPCDMAWDFDELQVTDDCGFTIRIVSTITNRLCGASYTATRTWEVSDGCTNITCVQMIEVVDQTPPMIVCPPDLVVTNLTEVPHCPKSLSEFILGGGRASDNCDTNLTYRCVDGPFVGGTCGGTIERTHTVIDGCSNSASCVQIIRVLGTPTSSTLSLVVSNNPACELPSLDQQMNGPLTVTTEDNFPVSFVRSTLNFVPPGFVVTNGTYLAWAVDYFFGQTLSVTNAEALLYRSDEALPGHLPQTNWDRVNYILNHKQGNSIDIQTAIFHFIGGPVPTNDPIFSPPSPTALNIISDALTNGSGFVAGPGQVFGVIVDLGTNQQLTVIEVRCDAIDPCHGGTLTFCASALGTGPITFAWLQDGQPIPGETNACLTLTNVTPADLGRYCLITRGACNSVTNCLSLPNCREVLPRPSISSIQFFPGSGAHLKISGLSGHTYYILCGEEVCRQWKVIGIVTVNARGSSDFVDTTAKDSTCRMYRLVEPAGH